MAERRAAVQVCVAGTILLASSACTFAPGQPWGALEPSLEVVFAPSESRITDEGWLRTSTDYALDLDLFAIRLDGLLLSQTLAGSAAPTAFDPADPPAGYSLCHGGHCHAADGSLVDYADIEAELAGAAGLSGKTLTAPVTLGLFEPAAEPTQVSLGECSDHCWLDRGTLSRVSVALSEVSVGGRVYDLRPGAGRRLPEEGVAIGGVLAHSVIIDEAIDEPFDGSEPVGLSLDVRLAVTPALFDGVDFEALAEEGAVNLGLLDDEGAAIASALEELSLLEITTERSEEPVADASVTLF
jgi:hypothetical protein